MTNLKYVGNGAWIPGVPARDLTAKEAARFADTIAQYPAGLYVTAGKAQPKAKADDLTRIDGIGPVITKALRAAGIVTIQQLIDADPVALDLHLDGSSEDQIRQWQTQAAQIQEDDK